MLFQKNILRKYLALLPAEQMAEAWSTFQSYFLNADIQQNILQSKEEQFQEVFLRELFVKVLGYTLNPSPDFNLITEQKNETNSKKADGAILLDGKVVGIIELKDHKTPDLSKVEPQAFGYKNQHPDARLVVISNFEKLRLYIDNTVEHIEWNLFTLTEQEFREMYLCLAFEQVKQETALKMKQESVSSEDQITKALYKDYSQFKRAAGEINGTQASRLRESSQPTAAGETPAYQRDSSLPSAAGEGTQASRLRDSSQPTAAGEGTQASRLRDNSQPTVAGETPAYHCRKYLPHIERQPFQFITFRLNDSLPKEAIDRLKSYRESLERFGTQASRLRDNSQPSAAGETPSYQRESSQPTAAGDGTQASRLRDNSLPSAAGDGTQASRLRNNSLPTAAGETPAYQSELRKLLIVLDKYEDAGYGQCFLRDERIAQIVQNALLHFHEERYELVQWCIMPNHVHVLVKTMPDISISDIMHSWRSFTAHEANMVLGRTGQFWMEEYFDRYIRDAEHFDSTVRYIRNNPVKAGLVSEPEQWPWAGDGTQASRLRDNSLPTAAGEINGTQASRLRDNSQPTAAGVWYAGVPPAG